MSALKMQALDPCEPKLIRIINADNALRQTPLVVNRDVLLVATLLQLSFLKKIPVLR